MPPFVAASIRSWANSLWNTLSNPGSSGWPVRRFLKFSSNPFRSTSFVAAKRNCTLSRVRRSSWYSSRAVTAFATHVP